MTGGSGSPVHGITDRGRHPLDDAVEVWVRDTGLGIPKDEQDKLFTRFFRASTATRNAVPGIGLGLTIIRAIVLAHGGTLTAESSPLGGLRITLQLPLLDNPS